jgi:nitrate/TMAO reductase-like tetraheme cytochrome c subunit
MTPEEAAPNPPDGAVGPQRRGLRRVLAPLLRGATQPLTLGILMIVVTVVVVFGGARTLAWMESPDFCARCHTMAPEVSEHAFSAHSRVECSECHIGSGLKGFVVAKLGGLRQSAKLLLGTYGDPIPPAADVMPPANDICLKCHDPAAQKANALITKAHYLEDEANTEQRVALVLRQSDDGDTSNGIHWHVLSTVEYIPRDGHANEIDWIAVERSDGTRVEYLDESLVEISEQAGRHVEELRANNEARRMTCYDCHNRVGHAEPLPGKAVDQAMMENVIDPSIPWVKKNAMEIVSNGFSSDDDLASALRQLTAEYHQNYPYLFVAERQALAESLDSIRNLGEQFIVARAAEHGEVYPDYLGHTDSSGCFRCHDGGHFKLDQGRLSDEAIPSTCSTCHTFPTTGDTAPNVMLGPPPQTHSNRLWVFEHKIEATAGGERANCSTCHSQTYCSNCHETGAKLVNHDNMLFDHGAVIRETTTQPCTYCHQKPSCERCHSDEELKDYPPPTSGGAP